MRNESKNLFHNDHYRNNSLGTGDNPMEIKITLSLLIGILILLSTVLFFHEYQASKNKVSNIEERMVKLEKSKSKRMPYEAMENILDARAALNREKEEFQFFISLIENAEAHLEKAVTVGTKRDTTE